jgi:carboxyl-terminal processing protease
MSGVTDMVEKPKYPTILVVIAIFLVVGACASGFIIGRVTTAVNFPGQTSSHGADTDELFVPFWEAWNLVNQYYVEQPVDEEKMMQGAIRGMLDALDDPHTSYLDPIQNDSLNASMEGYDGIGAYVSTEGELLTVIEPIKGSPAEAAGLRPGDEIMAIDGEEMTGVLPEIARQKVLGEAGTTVVLTILREGVEQPFDVEITRAHIIIPSVEAEMLDNQIAYVSLSVFSDTSASDLRTAIDQLLVQNPGGLILDLRNNSGGYLDSAIDVVSLFLSDGVAAYEEYGDGTRTTHEVTGKAIATEIPMVVLVNEWSASASEIVTGALQDRDRALVVGAVTYGKGTVQSWIPLSNEQGAIRVTIARWLTPDGTNVNEIGITPDYEIGYTEEEMLAGTDPQLERAIELLTQP